PAATAARPSNTRCTTAKITSYFSPAAGRMRESESGRSSKARTYGSNKTACARRWNRNLGSIGFEIQCERNHKEHREHGEQKDNAKIYFFVLSVVELFP